MIPRRVSTSASPGLLAVQVIGVGEGIVPLAARATSSRTSCLRAAKAASSAAPPPNVAQPLAGRQQTKISECHQRAHAHYLLIVDAACR